MRGRISEGNILKTINVIKILIKDRLLAISEQPEFLAAPKNGANDTVCAQ